jgi:hypothetical protein
MSDPVTVAPDRPLAFHHLSFQPDGEEVTVGRLDAGEFVALPADGAALLRELVDGRTPEQAADWYLRTYGEPIDVLEFAADLDELGFLRPEGETAAPVAPVRWQRLGRAVFSPAGAAVFTALLIAFAIAVSRSPRLLPHYGNLFFTPYMSVLILVTFATQLPLILVHEAAHTLAGRKLGLRSSLSVGRRLYYLVFQTTMDGLVAVPRRKRYLPILAGMLTDVAVLAVLTLIAAATQRPDGSVPVAGGVCLAMAYMTLLRLIWQVWFFLQTDLYFLAVTVLGCVDLHATAQQLLGNRWRTLLGRAPRHDPAAWHPKDAAVARWYAPLMVLGYAFSLTTMLLGVLPAAVRIFSAALGRLGGNGAQGGTGIADSVLFLVLAVGEIVLVLVLAVRDQVRRRRTAAVPS